MPPHSRHAKEILWIKLLAQRPQLNYFDRAGAYLIDIKEGKLACVRTPKGYFLLGGGIEAGESRLLHLWECLERRLAVTVTAVLSRQLLYTPPY